MIYIFLSQIFVVAIYAFFLPICLGSWIHSANLFTFRKSNYFDQLKISNLECLMLTTESRRCVLSGAENKIFFLVFKVIHKSNSFQTCSQSFNKIISSQKFYLPFKGNSQSATSLILSPETIFWLNKYGCLFKWIWLTNFAHTKNAPIIKISRILGSPSKIYTMFLWLWGPTVQEPMVWSPICQEPVVIKWAVEPQTVEARTVGPGTVGPRGPTIRPRKVDNWTPDNWSPGPNLEVWSLIIDQDRKATTCLRCKFWLSHLGYVFILHIK